MSPAVCDDEATEGDAYDTDCDELQERGNVNFDTIYDSYLSLNKSNRINILPKKFIMNVFNSAGYLSCISNFFVSTDIYPCTSKCNC